MDYSILKDLKPYEFFKWFGEICKIPHGSKNEGALIEFLRDFAEKRNIKCTVDKKGNLFMNIPASKGYENEPSILLQAHIDMVCVRKEDSDFDFEKDALRLKIKDDKLFAEGTSLGADNAVGVATMLAIADNPEILHPELEYLFTVEEEIGLVGIREFDMNLIRSRRMINMDCGDSHVLAVSSMGKTSANIEREFKLTSVKNSETALSVNIYDGIGGHAGLSSRLGRACAVYNMARLLSSLNEDFRICGLKTSEKAIFCSCEIVILVQNPEVVSQKLNEAFGTIKTIYEKTDPDIKLKIEKTSAPKKALTEKDSQELITLLELLKTGPIREDGNDNSILITLSILGRVSLSERKFEADFTVRSSNDADKNMLCDFYVKMANRLGFKAEKTDSYSGWREAKNSPFRDKAILIHKKLFDKEPELERVQGGIESSIITGKISDMDAIGFAPTARGAHTVNEHLYISQTDDFWQWMLSLLAEK